MKSLLKFLLRWAFGIGLLYWVLKDQSLKLQDITQFLLSSPVLALTSLICLFGVLWITSLRLVRVFSLYKKEIPLGPVFRMSWVGQFFGTMGPGTLGADGYKALQLHRRYAIKSHAAILGVFLDRFVALIVIGLSLAFLFLFARINNDLNFDALPHWINVLSFCSVIGAVVFCGMFFLLKASHLEFLKARLSQRFLRKPLEAFVILLENKKPFLILCLLSFAVHGLSAVILYFLAGNIDPRLFDLHALGIFYAIFFGLLVSNLPISPLGLGIGQVSFAAVFAHLGFDASSAGVQSITLFQLFWFAINLTGGLVFLIPEKTLKQST